MIWTLIFLAGVLTGLRTFTPLAVSTFFMRHGRLKLAGTPLHFLDTMAAHLILVFLALLEIVGDKLPRTPARTSAVGLTGRILMGGLGGAMLAFATAMLPWWQGSLVGVIGALVGTYAGWFVRTRTVMALRCPDWMVAVCEDLVAIFGSIWVMSHV